MKKKFTIITVVYNDYKNIEKTILSVINQTIFNQVEYIIIDGGSIDGTLEVVNSYKSAITSIVSEKDNGIYDAMNKGLLMSKGEWINFMNSGDSFFNISVLENILFLENDDSHIIYGSTNCFNSKNRKITPPNELNMMHFKLPFCHQSSFVRRDVLLKYKFDIKYKIAADYNLFYSLFIDKYNFFKVDLCISNYNLEGGISATKFYQLEREIKLINGKWDSIFCRISLNILNFKYLFGKFYKNIFK